jgi:hypothetical protein
MQKSFTNTTTAKKSTMSHFKRYSELDLRNDKIDRLLITQSNLFSQLKIKTWKTKLP